MKLASVVGFALPAVIVAVLEVIGQAGCTATVVKRGRHLPQEPPTH